MMIYDPICYFIQNFVMYRIRFRERCLEIYGFNHKFSGKVLCSMNKFEIYYVAREICDYPEDFKNIDTESFLKSYSTRHIRSIHKLEFPADSKIETIGRNALIPFTHVSLPKNIITIRKPAFDSYMCVSTIEVHPENRFYSKESIVFIRNFPFEALRCDFNAKRVFLREGTKLVGSSCFNNCGYIRSITIPSSVEIIDQFAFCSCVCLRKVIFSSDSRLRFIKNYAFLKSGVKSISLPPSVESVGYGSFAYCHCLKFIEFSKNSNNLKYCSHRFIHRPRRMIDIKYINGSFYDLIYLNENGDAFQVRIVNLSYNFLLTIKSKQFNEFVVCVDEENVQENES